MSNSPSINAAPENTIGVAPAPGKMILKITGVLFIAAAVACLIFGILGLMGVGLPDTFYLDNTITEARTLSANLDGVPMWTDASWQNLQSSLVEARTILNDRASTQAQIDAANLNLRQAIDSMVPSEAFADMEMAEFLPDGRTVSVFFTFLIFLFPLFAVIGILGIMFSTNIKKMNLLGTLGVIGVLGVALLIISAVDTLGPDVFLIFLPLLILPIAYLVGVFMNNRKISIIITFTTLVILSIIVMFPL